MYLLYTTQTLIRITLKISIGFNALSQPLWHSMTLDVLLQIQRNSQCWFKVQWATSVMLTTHKMVLYIACGLENVNKKFISPYCKRPET